MNTKPLVSIIMNCHNGEKYLKQAINSILTQTYENWEIIFWDNQSNDESAKIFKDYNDDRLKYYLADTHDEILNRARNSALKKAKGEYIAFLDTDDWWLPKKLEMQIPLFDDSEVGLVYGNVWLFFEKKNLSKKKFTERQNIK
jgi:glycosyltransferase involved in cell wall biosynthesis